MKQETIQWLNNAYISLQEIANDLYSASQAALDNEDLPDAGLLQSQADRMFEQALNFEVLILELEEQ
jgi:hypothetical protein